MEDVEDGEWITHVRSKLGGLSSCFAQLAHKAQTIFQTNAKLEVKLSQVLFNVCLLHYDLNLCRINISQNWL